MAVNPVQYLVVPRVVATLILMPMLAIISDFFCIFGAYVVMVKINHVDSAVFFETIRMYLDPIDIYIVFTRRSRSASSLQA
jgi:phospholipid/cholesterol/gamma-HCH transport system permease protein